MHLLGTIRGKRYCDNVSCGKEFKWSLQEEHGHAEVSILENLNVTTKCMNCGEQMYFRICFD